MHGSRRLRARLLAGAVPALVLATAAGAQTVPAAPSVPDATQAQGAAAADRPAATAAPTDAAAEAQPAEVVVTGSRIARPEFAAPNPITSFNASNIEQSGNTNVTNFLLRVPALTGSLDSTQSAGYDGVARNPFGGAGLNELNLRNLGTNRTLVLVDGRRHVAGEPSTPAVDINAIPTDLIERVDVLTGGASAVYGADGVSGVVNFILKRDFDGVAVRSQLGVSEYGDGATHFASAIAGRNFAGGRANVTLAYEYEGDDRVRIESRPFLVNGTRQYLVTNPNGGTPTNVLVGDLRYAGESPYGAVDVNGDGVADFRGDGQVYNQGRLFSYYAIGGDSTQAANYTGDLLPSIQRHVVDLLAHYDASDAFKLSFDGKFAQVDARSFYQYSGDYPAILSIDNPYMPQSIRTAAINAGQTSVSTIRDNFDLGRRGEDDRRRTYRGVVDLAGRLTPHATYDAYVTYGQTDVRITKLNDRLGDRFAAAIDVVTDPRTGKPTCRSSIDAAAAAALGATTFTPGPNSGCLPVNLFGLNTIDPAAVGFFTVNDVSQARITQLVADASVSGDFGALFTLPGGPVQFAFGGEYRRETSRFDPNSLLQNNQFFQYDEPGDVAPVRGSFDVKEAFGELNAPILSDKPFAHTLSVGAAGRYSHYSTIGDTGTYQFNGVYAPIRAVTFRGSYSQAVRAPNVQELFTPTAASTAFVNDPCDISQRNLGTQYRAANCTTLLRGLGVNPATYAPLSSTGGGGDGDGTAFGRFQGNPNLKAETARTWTAGVVLRPPFLRGLAVSADWYDIRLRGAINTPDVQTLVNLCVDQPTLANVYCSVITRRQGTGKVIGYIIEPQNVAQFRTAGLDLNLDYSFRTAHAGAFDIRLVGGYLDRLDLIATPGAAVENDVDQALPNRPRWNFVFSPTWSIGPLTLSYNFRYFDAERRFLRTQTEADPNAAAPDLLRYGAAYLSDLQAQVAVDKRYAFYLGVNNLTDQKPSPDSYDTPAPSLGRFYYAGVKLKFAR